MKNVFNDILESIGNTPLIRINKINPNPQVSIYAKLEVKNPGGSIKDRAALSMIETAESNGTLTKNKIIIEATSGNTGIGLAMVAAVKGYRIMLAMSETASQERQKILKALGAELILTPGNLGTDGAIEEVYRLVRENPDRYFMPDQFNNPGNPAAHYCATGPEIYEQTDGWVNAVVVTLGTTGTAMGILKAMKERDSAIKVIGVEPYPGHKIQGLKNMKESYVPGIFDRYALDRIIHVRDEEAFEMARRLAREEGIFVGMSSGAAMAGAVKLANENESGIIVTVLPDGGDRYLSTNLFTTMLEPDFRFFDLLRKEKIDFKPVQEGKVKIFVAGPPLDQPLTLQESRRFILSDLLTRFLQIKGFSINQIVLIPDLDSRTIQGSAEAKMDLTTYTHQQVDGFLNDLDNLGILRPHYCPKTTELAETLIEFVKILLDRRIAYEKLRSVYFDISQSKDYGELSGIDPRRIRPGTSVDLSAYEKLNPRDFTLLRRATLAELKRGIYMKTTWGNVLPTWHIAAVSAGLQHLGAPIDIHVSSVDFIFPHLENVRAIGEALTGKPFANVWMTCEQTWAAKNDDDSQNLTESTSIRELVARGYSPLEIRYWLLSIHYRKPIQVTSRNLQTAIKGYQRLKEFINRVQHLKPQGDDQDNKLLAEKIFTLEQQFFEALADDLNMANGLATIFKFIRQVNPILDQGAFSEAHRQQILDILNKLNTILGVFDLELQPLDDEKSALIHQRETARAQKRWDEADHLRAVLLQRGIRVVDTPQGTRWERLRKDS